MDTLTPEQRYYYEADLKIVRDTINQIRGAYEVGEEKGQAEARAEGRAEDCLKENWIRQGG